MDSRVDQIIKEQSQMEGERAVFDAHWQEIAERIFPRAADFQGERPQGAKNMEKVFDATAAMALDKFASAMDFYLTPTNMKWHGLESDDEQLNEDHEIQEWFEAAVKILFRWRYMPDANFAHQAHENYMGLGAFGNGAMFTDDALADGIRYKALHLSELWFSENHSGIVDKTHRKWKPTARQIVGQFAKSGMLPEKIIKAGTDEPEKKFTIIHCVKPNEERKPGSQTYQGMRFSSYYVIPEEKAIIEQGGYRTFPYAISRYVTQPRETYGRSPAMMVLPGIKMLNEMKKTRLRAGHMAVDPPLLLQEDGALSGFALKPGALNFGGVDSQGNKLVHPLVSGARLDAALEFEEAERKAINDAFYITLFQIAVDNPRMTATEVAERAAEKGMLLGPNMTRQQGEMLGSIIRRELDIHYHAGRLPPMPEKLAKAWNSVRVKYKSPLQQAQRAQDGVAILRTLEGITPLAQIDPSVLRGFKLPETARELAEINGMPIKLLHSQEEIDAMKEQDAMAAQAEQLLAAAPVAGKAAKDLAQAQVLAASAPNQQLPQIVPE